MRVSGRRAHELARKGESVEIAPREVEVHGIEILDYAYPRLRLQIVCGSGTYVRSIGRDLGESLGCGAVMSELTRTEIGPFVIREAVSLDELSAETIGSRLLPPLRGVNHLPLCHVTAEQLIEIGFGRSIAYCGEPLSDGETVPLVDDNEQLIALAEFQASRCVLQPRQVFIRR